MMRKSTHYIFLTLFIINTHLHTIYLRFINIFGSIFSYLLLKDCDGRTESRTEGETLLFYNNAGFYSKNHSCKPCGEKHTICFLFLAHVWYHGYRISDLVHFIVKYSNSQSTYTILVLSRLLLTSLNFTIHFYDSLTLKDGIIVIIIYHEFLTESRRGSHVN